MVLSRRNLCWDINEENVIETLHRAGGRLENRLLLGHFMSGIKDEKLVNKKSLKLLSGILDNVAYMDKNKYHNPIWKLKKDFI